VQPGQSCKLIDAPVCCGGTGAYCDISAGKPGVGTCVQAQCIATGAACVLFKAKCCDGYCEFKPFGGAVCTAKEKLERNHRVLASSSPGIIATLGGQALTKILKVIVDEIVSVVNNITINIPPCYRDSCAIDGVQLIINPDGRGQGTEGDIPIRGFKIGTSKIAFVEGKGIQVTLGELYFDLPPTGFRIAKNIGRVKPHCSGHFSGSLSNMQVVETVMIKDTSGSPTATESSLWTWGQGVKFDVSMTHNFCKFIKNIAQWFIGNINQLVVNKIKDLLPPALDKLIKTSLNDLLQGLVLKTKIDNYASIEFGLTQNPSFANNALEVFLSGQVVKT